MKNKPKNHYQGNDNSWYKDYHKKPKIKSPKKPVVVKGSTGHRMRICSIVVNGEEVKRTLKRIG